MVESDDSQIEEKNDPTHNKKIIEEIFVPDMPVRNRKQPDCNGELTEQQIKDFVDALRVEIGPLRYARFLIEPEQNRLDTVGFISFYNLAVNVRCIRNMRHTLQLMLPHDTHYVQFKPNHDINHRPFNKKPCTLLRVYDLKDE
ncbi:unnamed protein product [Brachionus calyciflorus]|uniref:Uncharacterized protein n=1 Tax=Brachionus calyciflorus TaxID=104777 RepID=A0A814KG96_9BILA|nr:unnamed protein product [Brachionus calyciflorus]